MRIFSFVLAILLVCVIPILVLQIFNFNQEVQSDIIISDHTDAPGNQSEKMVIIQHQGESLPIPVEEYIVSVVLAEMPASFELEALKAQAVVARTQTYRKMEHPKHGKAALCTDANCCQGYMPVAEYIEDGGDINAVNRILTAVNDTIGQVMIYNGQYIDATYFSCSGGRTEDAADVWGSDVPYLQSVESPGEESTGYYSETLRMTTSGFCAKIDYTPPGVSEDWFGNVSYTEGGGVASMEIGDRSYSGVELRKKLNLRSTAFVMTAIDDYIVIMTKGFGHRVGMSQYGADAMAVSGYSYKEILCYYYQGAELSDMVS